MYEAIVGRRSDVSQPVAIIYAVEQLLKQLRDCRGQFTVCFFKCYEPAWGAYDSLAPALRQIIKSHLSASGISVATFQCWGSSEADACAKGLDCQDFFSFVHTFRPTFMLVSDEYIGR